MFLNFYNRTTENYLLKCNAWETHTIKPVNEDDNLKTIRDLCAYDNIVFRQYDSYEKPFSIPSKKHLPLYEVNQEKISTVVIYYDYNSDDASCIKLYARVTLTRILIFTKINGINTKLYFLETNLTK